MVLERRWIVGILILLLPVWSILAGCHYEGIFFPGDVDVAATDESGNPTELFITDLGHDLPCTTGQDSAIYRVDLSGAVLWAYDYQADLLNGAHNADLNPAGDQMIVSDSCNNRVLVIGYPEKAVLWDSNLDCPEMTFDYPNDANFLGDGIHSGHLLITVRDEHWFIELDPALCDNGVAGDEIVWSFGVRGVPRASSDFEDATHLRQPHNADALPNGNFIISDSGVAILGPSRIIEVDREGRIVWTYKRMFDCTVEGVPDSPCPALSWARDADVECTDPDCTTGRVTITGIHQTVVVERDLSEAPPPGETAPRGRTVLHQVQHGLGFSYDTDKIPQWNGDTNEELGYFLVSNHGPLDFGRWVLVKPVDAEELAYDWMIKTLTFGN
ncbi:MAG: hypothetical protein AB1640_01500 [bacterium]